MPGFTIPLLQLSVQNTRDGITRRPGVADTRRWMRPPGPRARAPVPPRAPAPAPPAPAPPAPAPQPRVSVHNTRAKFRDVRVSWTLERGSTPPQP